MQATRGWKSDEERGLIGAWFVRAIGERSIEAIAKDMADRGHIHNPDYYRGIMSGSKKPGRALLAALSDYLGSSPEAKATDQSDLAAAIRDQTQAISDLVALLRPLVESHDQRVKDLAQVVGTLTERALRDDPEPVVQPETAG